MTPSRMTTMGKESQPCGGRQTKYNTAQHTNMLPQVTVACATCDARWFGIIITKLCGGSVHHGSSDGCGQWCLLKLMCHCMAASAMCLTGTCRQPQLCA